MASDYAKAVPYIRAVLSMLPDPSQYRELMESESLAEALSTASAPAFPGVKEAKSMSALEPLLWRDFASIVVKAVKLSPAKAKYAVGFNLMIEDAKDVISTLYSLRAGNLNLENISKLPTSAVEGTTLNKIVSSGEEPESVEAIVNSAPSPLLRKLYIKLASLLSEPDKRLILYAPGPLAVSMLEAATSSLPRESSLVWRVYCPRIKFMLISGVLQAKYSGVDARSLDTVYKGVSTCGFNWDGGVRQIYESEDSAAGLAVSLSQVIPGVRLEGGDVGSMLETLRQTTRAETLRSARAALAGYPFQAGFIAGGLEVARLAFEDMAYVLASIHMKLHKERVLARISQTY
ncbi:hypothetical protein [Aeropyrum camini]|uniref:Uncharacterized protein n=1 Tax=Aeropyrum camini SY1 = JCM 12091 TaxID=1198449 RepID=U3TGA0_9CREN|nr:hypothetical protein [Aeropyrum camini]BAN90354.1 hypothetical protein ACAM_0885 [Aeropyrum camini SY1 = JCM 12091]